MVNVTWTERARKDLDDISAFIAGGSPYYAERTEVGIFEKSLMLELQPLAGHVVQEVNDPTIREISYGSYRIIYWVMSQEHVSVIAVVHGKRKLQRSSIRERRTLT